MLVFHCWSASLLQLSLPIRAHIFKLIILWRNKEARAITSLDWSAAVKVVYNIFYDCEQCTINVFKLPYRTQCWKNIFLSFSSLWAVWQNVRTKTPSDMNSRSFQIWKIGRIESPMNPQYTDHPFLPGQRKISQMTINCRASFHPCCKRNWSVS